MTDLPSQMFAPPAADAAAPQPLYRPTPLEEAYGHFLLDQVFGVPFRRPPPQDQIIISGRNAVPFLTQSGLDRAVLRTVWNVADPANVGTLTCIGQFHLMLRLVALTQAGLAELGASANPPSADSFRILVQRSVSQPVPLASFAGVAVPPQEQLLGTYGAPPPPLHQQQPPSQQASFAPGLASAFASGPTTSTTTIDDAFGSLLGEVQDAPLGGGGGGLAAAATPGGLGWGGGLGGGQPPHNNFGGTVTDNNKYNNVMAMTPPSVPPSGATSFGAPATVSHVSRQSIMSSLSDASFTGDLGDVTSGMQPRQQQHHHRLSSTGSLSDAFSNVVGASPIDGAPFPDHATTAAAAPIITTMMMGMSGPSSVASASSDRSSQLQHQQQPQQPQQQQPQQPFGYPQPQSSQYGMGGGGSLASGIITGSTFPSTTFTDGSSYFGANAGPTGAAAFPPPSREDEDDDDDDDFGGFAGATPADPSPFGATVGPPSMGLAPTTYASQTPDLGSTVASSTDVDRTIATGDIISDAFSGFGAELSDAPLPSLDAFGAAASAVAAAPPETEIPTTSSVDNPGTDGGMNDDGFAGFEEGPAQVRTSVVAAVSENEDDDDDDEFGDFGSATQPSVDSNPTFGGQPQHQSDFYSFQSQPPPPSQPQPFMTDMGRALSAPTSSSGGGAAFGLMGSVAVTDVGRSLSVSDAFDAFEDMVPVHDAPLPSLEAFGSLTSAGSDGAAESTDTVNVSDSTLPLEANDEGGDDDDDAFGGFGSAPAAAVGGFQQEAPEFAAFGNGASSANAVPAVSDLGRTMSEPVTSSGPLLPAGITNTGRSLSVSEAFGELPGTQQDAPSPSLDVMGGVTTTLSSMPPNVQEPEGGGDDEFGTFVSPADVASLSNAGSLGFEASFGGPAVTDLGRTMSEPTPSIPAHFPSLTDTRSLSISDAFGDIPVHDAPLPSLDGLEEMIPTPDVAEQEGGDDGSRGDDDEDDFGDFGGFVDGTSAIEEAFSTGVNQLATSSTVPPVQPDFRAFDGTSTEMTGIDGDGQALELSTADSDFLAFGDELPPQMASVGRTSSEPFPSLLSAVADPASSMSLVSDAYSGRPTQPSQDLSRSEISAIATHESYSATGESNDAEFGDFGSADFAAAAETWKPDTHVSGDPEGPFAAFDSPPAQTDEKEFEVGGAFGDFGAAQQGSGEAESCADGVGQSVADVGDECERAPSDDVGQEAEDDDDFGDFQEISVPGPPVTETNGEPDFFAGSSAWQVQTSEDPVTGAFDVQEPALSSVSLFPAEFDAVEEAKPDDFDEFQNVASFDDAFTEAVASAATLDPVGIKHDVDENDDDDDDWGDFEDVPAPAATTAPFAKEAQLRDRIRSLSLQLPEALLLKADFSGDHVDLGDAFEVHIGIKSTMDAASKRRVDRCIQVLELLSRDHSKLASTYWVQVLDVANEELELARGLLNEARTLPADAWTSPGGRAAEVFSTLLAGLAEYMRVARSIVASIGDVLLLDESAMLTIDTWASSWCSLSILQKALETEGKWRGIEKLLVSAQQGGAPSWPLRVPHCATLQEIRSRGASIVAGGNSRVCQLTLQPLSADDRDTTRAEVSWRGGYFMACSANFLAHRCPFFVVPGG